ncbi:unnamed protein product [Amoebophrya sp. A120]|nr:unnamed protein product [Amoebophrya sp. A120]|eukprot:GSA120T00020359001.1
MAPAVSTMLSRSKRGLFSAALLAGATTAAPVKKMTAVIKILEDMRDEIEHDQAEDEKSYAKMECWCKKNDMTLSEAQAAAQAELERLRASVTANTAEAAALATELEGMEKELKQARESLDELITMNTKQVEEDGKTVAEYTESITALANALTVLNKHQPGLTQKKVVLELRKHVSAHSDMLDALLEPSQRRELNAFLQQDTRQNQKQNPTSPAYSSQSGQIFGILAQMKEEFESDLATLKEKVASDKVTYNKLKKSKEEGIADLEKGITSKTSRKADAKQEAADAKQQIADIEKTMAADLEFLAEVKKVCPKSSEEFAKRTEDRHMESQAIDKAVEILGSDENRDLFDKTVEKAPALAFLQTGMMKNSKEVASKVVQNLARLPGASVSKTALNLLSQQIKLAPFTRVVEAIKTMISEIKEKKEVETEQKDECVSKMNENEKETAAAENELSKFRGQLEKAEADLAAKMDSLTKTETAIKEAEESLGKLEEDRKEEFAMFQQNLADQSTAVELLGKAIAQLTMVYENLAKPTFLQTGLVVKKQAPAAEAGPSAGLTHTDAPEMGTYKKNNAGTGVVAMLQGIQDEARKTIKEMRLQQEQDQADFQKQRDLLVEVKQSSELQLSTLKFEKADLDKTISQKNRDINDKVSEIAGLVETMKSFKEECDFLLKHFDVRQEAMTTEVEALNQAIAILKGSDAGGELQTIYANPTSL